MLIYKNKKFMKVSGSDLKEQSILERFDLQETIKNSWDLFKKEIGIHDLFLIGDEVQPHSAVKNRIDLLAFDPNTSSPVVIELKRGRDKLQLLQAISYGSMVASWEAERFIEEARRSNSPDLSDIEALLNDLEVEPNTKLILLAESYDPEVIISADWLYQNYDLDITAFGIDVFVDKEEQIYFNINQKYPLPELHETYEERNRSNRKKKPVSDQSEVTWDEVAEKIEYKWGKKLIELCRQIKEGDPGRRRFGLLRTQFDNFNWISVHIRQKYANIYIKGKPEGAEELLQQKFREEVEIGKWRDGYSIIIDSESKYRDCIKWLQLEAAKKAA